MNDIDVLLQQARAAADAGELEAARQIYEHCLELDPTDPAVQGPLALLLMRQKKYEAALKITLQMIKHGESMRAGWAGYEFSGTCYHDLGQLVEAEQMYRRAIEIKPHPWTFIFLYMVLLDADHEEEGMSCLQEALILDPNHEEAHYNLGCYYGSRKQYKLAEQHLRRAIEIDLDYALAYAELGDTLLFHAYATVGDKTQKNVYINEAKRMLLRAIELNPKDGWSRIFLASLLWHSGKYGAAEEQYQAALTIWPRSCGVHSCYGDFLSATDRDRAKAGQLLRKSIKLEPDNEVAYYVLGKHLLC